MVPPVQRLCRGIGNEASGGRQKQAGTNSVSGFPPVSVGAMTEIRTASLHRVTAETDIRVNVNLDGAGEASVSNGIGF